MENAEAVYRFFEVVIVGGGIAGLSAADTLIQNGITNFTILEASSRLGGRMYTTELDNGNIIDLGAQFIDGSSNANSIYNLAVKNNLLVERASIEDEEKLLEQIYTSEGRLIDHYNVEKALELFVPIEEYINYYFYTGDPNILPEENNVKIAYEALVAEALNKFIASEESEDYIIEDIAQVLYTLRIRFEIISGDLLEDIGLFPLGSLVNLPGGDSSIPGGTKSIIDTFGKEITDRVRLQSPVSKIEWSGDGVTAYSESQGSSYVFCASHVISTLPLGVLQNEIVQIMPPLNKDQQEAIKNLRSGTLVKIYLQFDAPFWLVGSGTLLLSWSEKELEEGLASGDWKTGISIMHEDANARDVLIMFAVGAYAEIIETLDDQQILEGAADILKRFTGDPAISKPDRIVWHKWLSDPFTMGVWSHPSPYTNVSDYGALQVPLPSEENPRLLLAGEYTHSKYSSTMHGARLTGIDQANKIIKFIKEKN